MNESDSTKNVRSHDLRTKRSASSEPRNIFRQLLLHLKNTVRALRSSGPALDREYPSEEQQQRVVGPLAKASATHEPRDYTITGRKADRLKRLLQVL